MNDRHVIKYFSDWYSNRLQSNVKKRVSNHLNECEKCRIYFRKMAEVLNKPNVNTLPHLKADPWLAVKVKHNQESREEVRRIKPVRRFEWTLVGFVTSLMICIGVYVGSGLQTTANNQTSNTNMTTVVDTTQNGSIANAYYQAFSQTNMADQWASVLDNN